MNGYNFTERVRRVLQVAREESLALRHEYVATEHILLGICRDDGGVAAATLDNLGVDKARVRDAVLEVVKPGPADAYAVASASGGILGAIADTIGMNRRDRVDLPYTSRAKKVLELAMTEARNLQPSNVATDHPQLRLLKEERGIAAQHLVSVGLTTDATRPEATRLHGEIPPPAQPAAAGERSPSAPANRS